MLHIPVYCITEYTSPLRHPGHRFPQDSDHKHGPYSTFLIDLVMTNEPLNPAFPYRNYTDYIADLYAVDKGYTALYNLFSSRPIRRREPSIGGVIAEVNQDRSGSVVILDSVGGRLDRRQYMVSKVNGAKDVESCIKDIEQGQSESHTRVIFVNYYRSLLYADYSGLDISILDAIGYKYKIHPEVYMWHFGSDFGIFHTYFPSAKSPLPSALSNNSFFHLWNHHSIVSTYLHTAAGARKANTGRYILIRYKEASEVNPAR